MITVLFIRTDRLSCINIRVIIIIIIIIIIISIEQKLSSVGGEGRKYRRDDD